MSARNLLAIATAALVGLALLAAPASAVSPSRADAAPGTISGTAMIESWGGAEGMRVSARPFAGGPEVASDLSDDQGRYSLTVPPGEYLVTLHSTEFRGIASFDFDHYSEGAGSSSTDRIEEARPVAVAEGADVTAVNLMAWPAMGFDGQVVSSDASLLPGLVVTLYESDGSVADTDTITSKDVQHGQATYSMGGLRTGTYRIGVRNGGLVDEPNAATFKVIVDTGNSQWAPDIRVRRYTTNTARPRISSGSPRVGSPQTVSVGRWTRTEGVVWRYRWYINGKQIAGAKQARYTPAAGKLGKRLTAKVWAFHRGDLVGTATSGATKKVAHGRIEVARRPSLTGTRTPVVGRTLGRDLGHWKPSGLKWRHQWLRNGKAIAGQRGRTYRLRSADVGKRVSLRVTASRTGYHSRTQRTASVVVKRAPR